MPTFQPPYADHVPPVAYDRAVDPLAIRLARHYKSRARGQSVLKLDGVYVTVETPSQDQMDAASEVYQGGHVYTVSQTVADALETAGYETGPDVVVADLYEWGDLAVGSWEEFAAAHLWIGS